MNFRLDLTRDMAYPDWLEDVRRRHPERLERVLSQLRQLVIERMASISRGDANDDEVLRRFAEIRKEALADD